MTITYRTQLTRNLTAAEVDANFETLDLEKYEKPVGGIIGADVNVPSLISAGLAPINVTELAKPNAGRGEMIVSWQTNPLQSALTGTAVDTSSVYPEPITLPQALKPIVYQAYNATGQCRATAEIGSDAVWTAVQFTPSITPVAVAANTTAEQSFTCTGITTLHRIVNIIPFAAQVNLRIVAMRCDAADTLKITWQNVSGSSITPSAGTFTVNTRLTSGGAQSSVFNTIGVWAKAKPRADGQPYTYCSLDFFPDISVVTNRLLAPLTVRADGNWRFYTLNYANFGSAGTSVLGVTRWDYVRVLEQGGATSLTLTAAPTAGATSATLTSNFAGTTETYPVRFSSNEVRLCQMINGQTSITWGNPLTASATTAIVYATTALSQGATEAVQIGPIYRNPVAKPFAYIRFDDSLLDQYVARQTLSTPFVGQSGVTLPVGAYSGKDIVNAFGLKANLFILTSCIGKPNGNFLSVAQMRDLQDNYGWDICFQTHNNPASLSNSGGNLLGGYGYNWSINKAGGIASVDTTANTITTNSAHDMLTPGIGAAGLQGQPIIMTGTDLPAPLTVGTIYWPRPTSTTAFQLHPTELDSAQNTNRIDLTTTGIPANFGYRYAYATQDSSGFLNDVQTGQALMQGWGFNGWKHIALNQGSWGYDILQSSVTLKASGNLQTLQGTQGATGTPTLSGYAAHSMNSYSSFGGGFVGGGQMRTIGGEILNLPQNLGTEATTEQAARDYIDNLVLRGSIGGNYHHFFSTEASMRNLCAYCDQIKLRVDQGVLSTGTMTELYSLMAAAGTN